MAVEQQTQVKEGRSGFRFFLLSVCTASPILVFFASKSSCVCVCVELSQVVVVVVVACDNKKRRSREKWNVSRVPICCLTDSGLLFSGLI